MKARRFGEVQSVSPLSLFPAEVVEDQVGDDECDDEENEDDEDEEVSTDVPFGDKGERIGLEKEGDFVRKLGDPKLPTQEEVDEHNIRGHFPYRSWCPICVEAMGKDMAHRKDEGKERTHPEYSFDYCFPGDESGFKWTVLVGTEKGGRLCHGHSSPFEGRGK